jgi:hypothetical protein
MKIIFENRRRDLMIFYFFEIMRSWLILVSAIIMAGLVIYVNFAYREEGESVYDAIGISLIVILTICLGFLFLLAVYATILASSRKHKATLTQHTMKFTDSCILSESEYGKGEASYNLLQNIRETHNYILLYIGLHTAIIIPKKYVGGKSDQESFIAEIGSLWRKNIHENSRE